MVGGDLVNKTKPNSTLNTQSGHNKEGLVQKTKALLNPKHRLDITRELLLGVCKGGLRLVKLGLYDPGREVCTSVKRDLICVKRDLIEHSNRCRNSWKLAP